MKSLFETLDTRWAQLFLALGMLSMVATSCNDDDDSPNPTPVEEDPNLVVACFNSDFSILVEAIRTAGLVEPL